MTKKIFLCGFMASGKTTVGKALSQKLEIPFFDTDAEIEKISHFNIMEIFLNRKELYFRKLATKILNSLNNKTIDLAISKIIEKIN